MNNRRLCHSLRSAVFPSSLLKLIILLKKVTARGIESRLRRVMTGERGKTTFNFSNGNIGFYDLLLMIITTRREGGDTLSVSCPGPVSQSRSILHMCSLPTQHVNWARLRSPGLARSCDPAATRAPSRSRGLFYWTHVTRRGSGKRRGGDSDMNKFLTILWL